MAPAFAVDFDADAADLLSAPIAITAAGLNPILIGGAGIVIRVYRLAIITAAANSLTFQDGAIALSGAMSLSANEGMAFDFETKPWFTITPGNNFGITLTAAAFVNGILYYTSEGGSAIAVAPTPVPPPTGTIDSQPLGMP